MSHVDGTDTYTRSEVIGFVASGLGVMAVEPNLFGWIMAGVVSPLAWMYIAAGRKKPDAGGQPPVLR